MFKKKKKMQGFLPSIDAKGHMVSLCFKIIVI